MGVRTVSLFGLIFSSLLACGIAEGGSWETWPAKTWPAKHWSAKKKNQSAIRGRPAAVTPEGLPRQRIGYPQFVGQHDSRNRAAVYGHPSYHNEYPTPDYPVVAEPNRMGSMAW